MVLNPPMPLIYYLCYLYPNWCSPYWQKGPWFADQIPTDNKRQKLWKYVQIAITQKGNGTLQTFAWIERVSRHKGLVCKHDSCKMNFLYFTDQNVVKYPNLVCNMYKNLEVLQKSCLHSTPLRLKTIFHWIKRFRVSHYLCVQYYCF